MSQPTFHFLMRTDLICLKFFHNLLLKKKFLILTWKINKFLYLQKKVRAPFRCFFAILYSIIVLIFWHLIIHFSIHKSFLLYSYWEIFILFATIFLFSIFFFKKKNFFWCLFKEFLKSFLCLFRLLYIYIYIYIKDLWRPFLYYNF